MNKTVLVGVAILTLTTSAASALTHRTHHSRTMKPNTPAVAMSRSPYAGPRAYAAAGAPPAAMPGMSSKNQEMYMKNLHDSGYNPKNDFNKDGTIRQH